MHPLLCKLAALAAGLWVLLNAMGILADRVVPVNVWYVEQAQNYAEVMRHKEEIQALSLGNSHSEAVDFDVLGMRGQTLARAASDLFEMERYAATVSNSLPNLKAVFLALSYYSFSRDNATSDKMRILRIDLYTMLPTWRPITGDARNMVLGKLQAYGHVMSVARPDHGRSLLDAARRATPSDDSAQSEVPVPAAPSDACQYLTPGEMDAHAREIAGKNVSSSRAMAAAHRGLQADASKALMRTIEHLQAKGIEVILYTPPYYEAYTTYFAEQAPEIMEEMHREVERIQEKYDVAYYDFSRDPDIMQRPELFVNSDHVNDCGRRAFSERLLRARAKTDRFGGGNVTHLEKESDR